jgi:hypothetical protein
VVIASQHYPTTLDIGMLLNIAAGLRDADLVEQARPQPAGSTPAESQSLASDGTV